MSTPTLSRPFAKYTAVHRAGSRARSTWRSRLLNDSGVKAEQAKKAGGEASVDNFDEALDLLAGVLARDPRNPYAHFCRGIILEQQGRIVEAHQHFKNVTEIDPQRRRGLVLDGKHLARPRAAGPAGGPESSQRADGPVCQGTRSQSLLGARDLQDGDDRPVYEPIESNSTIY